jgi:cell division septation protein DedD
MSEEVLTADEQSHYEISLTAGQAFVAFVLLLLSLAASFAFGLMIGRGQADERLVVKKEPAVITEAGAVPKKSAGKIVELGVADQDFSEPKSDKGASAAATETAAPIVSEATQTVTEPGATAVTPPKSDAKPADAKPVAVVDANAPKAQVRLPTGSPAYQPAYAQLLSTSDQKTAEALAAKLINGGFTNAYVERMVTEKGTIFRVRIKFPAEAEARANEAKLKQFAPDVWITK